MVFREINLFVRDKEDSVQVDREPFTITSRK